MKKHEVYICGCGGNLGCTEKLMMALPDFALCVDGKFYRFDLEDDGNLSILCINGINEKIDVKHGYKNLIITASGKYDPYDDDRKRYLEEVKNTKDHGCHCPECGFHVDSFIYNMCQLTGEDFRLDGCPESSRQCPFKD